MNTNHSDRTGTDREFYAPATFQFSMTPGAVERTLARLFRRRGAMTGRPRPAAAVREFYAPATFQFTPEPGRVERLVGAVLRQRGAMDGRGRADASEYAFYAPATTRDAFLGKGRRSNPR